MPRVTSTFVVAFALSLIASTFAPAQQQPQRGDVTGSFHLIGPAPPPRPIVGGGPGMPAGLVDESLVLGPAQEIANVVIFLEPTAGAPLPAPPVAVVPPPTTIAAAGFRFDPHVTVIEVGKPLEVVNRDPSSHNVKGDLQANPPFSDLIQKNGAVVMQFKVDERIPLPISDSIHPWMNGHLMIAPTAYNAVTDANGNFTIAGVPVGTWTFRIWHERIGWVDDLTVKGQFVRKPKGRFTVDVAAGNNDLGPLQIAAEELR